MGGYTFGRKALFATTSLKKGGGRIFEGGLIFGRLQYSQSQIMFVTTLRMDKFDCTKRSAHFKKFTTCLREGLIQSYSKSG